MRTVQRICVAGPLSAVLAVLGLLAGPAASALAGSESFTSPGEHPFVVPAGVTSVQVLLVGGNGGTGSDGQVGGIPATASATIAVTPGETLYAEVAGDGESAGDGAFGSGGAGGGGAGGVLEGFLTSDGSGGGGGGASDIRTCSVDAGSCQSLASRLIVAAGGGGGAGAGSAGGTETAGGTGGSADQSGSDGVGDGRGDLAGTGGGRGTLTTPGAAGTNQEPSGYPASSAGALGVGGAGGVSNAFAGSVGGGGGGGGGIYGGGGGGEGGFTSGSPTGNGAGGGGGGGGSSGVPAGAPGVSAFSLLPTTDGAEPEVTITTLPAPAITTGAASDVTASTAELTGTVNPNGSPITDCHFVISPAPADGASAPCAQQLGAGSSPSPVSATLSGLSQGTAYTVTLSATSTAGSTRGVPITFKTSGAAGPAVTDLRLARRVHRASPKGKHARPLVTLTLRLSQSASLTFTFQRALTGRRSRGSCVATGQAPPRASRCVYYVPVPGELTLAAFAGISRIRFHGELDNGKRLALGAYRMIVTATNSDGPASRSLQALFALVP